MAEMFCRFTMQCTFVNNLGMNSSSSKNYFQFYNYIQCLYLKVIIA